ncbi:YaiI/YqxD family protein [Gluconacetobacter tumulisoli]|uniref:UPF0178 protein HLH28_05155 n=1 Tax=Gluconacetobacter tumulisoli TaxID=1286189 RepID=A0A7W4K5Y5_9PROT|nr:YaiI/YqxD family protein [Gluconacetobacter tumulisoli]MBB2200971.1 YaiI/YqxD family protein [Gluconacetobacter tumulisoli]
MTRIFIDADACPVKDETYRVALRYGIRVFVVSNRMIAVPDTPLIERVVVDHGPDVADDWIVDHVGPADIVVTADIPLAARCVAGQVATLDPKGRLFDADSIGMTLAMRNLMDDLRSTGTVTTHNRPFGKADRSAFLSALDTVIVRLRRRPVAVRRPPEG